jgi:Flp pilus assembly protein TadG
MKTLKRLGAVATGQAVVEFSLAVIVFLVMLMGVFDLGRGIYEYNGVSQAAREIARRTSTHTVGVGGFGQSTETLAAINTQRGLIPELSPTPTIECVDSNGTSAGTSCTSGEFVRVTVTSSYTPISLLGLTGTFTFSSTSNVQVP